MQKPTNQYPAHVRLAPPSEILLYQVEIWFGISRKETHDKHIGKRYDDYLRRHGIACAQTTVDEVIKSLKVLFLYHSRRDEVRSGVRDTRAQDVFR
jgi:hypothetical protein